MTEAEFEFTEGVRLLMMARLPGRMARAEEELIVDIFSFFLSCVFETGEPGLL